MTKFNRSPTTNPYAIITPDTPLAELESFLRNHIFALSTYFFSRLQTVVHIVLPLVTDYERKFVLGVATSQDLEVNHPSTYSGDSFGSDPSSHHTRHSFRGVASDLIAWDLSWSCSLSTGICKLSPCFAGDRRLKDADDAEACVIWLVLQ